MTHIFNEIDLRLKVKLKYSNFIQFQFKGFLFTHLQIHKVLIIYRPWWPSWLELASNSSRRSLEAL